MADNTTTEAAVSQENQDWNPDDDEFIGEVLVAGVFLFCIGVAVLAAFFIYYMVRCVCWRCLGDECCDKRNKVRASQSMVKWNNLFISALLLACIAGGAWLLYAGTPIINSLESLTATLVEEADTFEESANRTITTVEAAAGGDDSVDLTELKEAQTLLGETKDDFESLEKEVGGVIDSFGGVIIFVGVCAIVCAILGLLCVFVRSIIFLYLYFIVATFTVFFLWGLAGFAFVGNEAFQETCTMMDLHAQGQRNQFVIDNLPCEELAQAGKAVEQAQLGANAQVEDGNASIDELNNQPLLQLEEEVPKLCVPYVQEGDAWVPNNATDCVTLTEENVEAEYLALVCPDPAVTDQNSPGFIACALAVPATPIPNATYTELIDSANALELLNKELPTIAQISSCGFVDIAFRHIVDSDCDRLKTDSERLATAALISAITLTITSFYFCICIQNIRKQDAPQAAPGEDQFVEEGKVV